MFRVVLFVLVLASVVEGGLTFTHYLFGGCQNPVQEVWNNIVPNQCMNFPYELASIQYLSIDSNGVISYGRYNQLNCVGSGGIQTAVVNSCFSIWSSFSRTAQFSRIADTSSPSNPSSSSSSDTSSVLPIVIPGIVVLIIIWAMIRTNLSIQENSGCELPEC